MGKFSFKALMHLKVSKILTLFIVFALLVGDCFAQEKCENLLLKPTRPEQFLLDADNRLHLHSWVARANNFFQSLTGKNPQKPIDRVVLFIRYLERLSKKAQSNPKALEALRQIFYNEYVLQASNVPQSYFDGLARIARKAGRGDEIYSTHEKERHVQILIRDQQSSLNGWIDYFISPDTNMYPAWVKYWIITNVAKLSQFDAESGTFGNRTKQTVIPFPEINREALAYVINAVLKQLQKQNLSEIQDETLLQLLEKMNFGKLYGYALLKAGHGRGQFPTSAGKWVTYEKGSDHMALVASLENQGTGWCTAGEATAKEHLAGGDFHVYYSYNEVGQPIHPRIAIRMEKSTIAEVRGVAPEQNFDAQIAETSVLQNKLKEFGAQGVLYQKRSSDMKRLSDLDERTRLGQVLNKDDLFFLYEINSSIEGFGFKADPRIVEIKSRRDIKADLVEVFNGRYKKEEISLTKEEALSGRFKAHYGDLDLGYSQSAEGITLPEFISGNLNLKYLVSAKGLVLPKHIGKGLDLRALSSVEKLVLPEYVGGELNLDGLKEIREAISFPKHVGGMLSLFSLKTANTLIFPQYIGGGLNLFNLASVKEMTLPQYIGGNLNLFYFKPTSRLELPQYVGGDLNLHSLVLAENVVFPGFVGGTIDLTSLLSVQNVHFPREVGKLILVGLSSKQGFIPPEKVQEIKW